ncbi:MAG TPA: protocatechuate 3,4-dioxygenase [Alphaproteobacteria bacterium]|nr:protocatechuate 3,4-dioxygenase [Alphaproteobacteria bacterium]
MAKIVLAMATTHGPQLHTTVEQWQLRVKADKARRHPFRNGVYGFDELVSLRKSEGLEAKSSIDAQRAYHQRCHIGMAKLADKWDEIKPDVAVILGNDQDEVYETDQLNPPFMVFYGDTIPNYPQSEERRKALPPGVAEAEHGHATEAYTEYPGVPELGRHIIDELIANDFDVAASKQWPKNARNGASHAFGHIYRQVMRDKVVPNVPIYQNTFFPPNQPKASRAYAFGRIVRKAIERWPSDKRVAVFASGGMSHFVIDEEFDRAFVGALKRKDKAYLTSIPLSVLQSGTSELKSWISLAGLLEDVDGTMHEIDYIPCYRSPAGTGTANGFYWWEIRR